MKTLAIFTTPETATVELRHDAGMVFHGVPGTADGRPAHILSIDGVPDGWGARLVVTAPGYVPVSHRGALSLTRPGPRAEFAVDDITLTPTGGEGGEYTGGRLRAENGQFWSGDTRWVAKLHSDFRVLKMWMDHESLIEIETQRQEAGSDGPRVFGSCDWLFKLDPRQYPDYYARLTDFAKYQADRGACWEYVAYTDRQLTGLGDDHWARACEALADQPGLLIQLVNEHFKNGVDPRMFRPIPNGVPQCPGSFVDGMGPPVNPMWPGGYNAFNPNRNWKWPVTVGITSWELATYPGGNAPLLIDEPIGAAEQPKAGSRASDPALFEKMAVDCALWTAGGVFHSQNGLQSGLWGPVQMACAEGFFRGLRR